MSNSYHDVDYGVIRYPDGSFPVDSVKEIIQQNAVQLKRLQDEIGKLSSEVKRLEQYETFYRLYKGLKE